VTIPDVLAESYFLGKQHAQYFSRILETTAPSRQAALREGAEARLRRYLLENLPHDAPIDEAIEHASAGFSDGLTTTPER
jgi:hypothetical protein